MHLQTVKAVALGNKKVQSTVGWGVWGGGAVSVHFIHPARPPAVWCGLKIMIDRIYISVKHDPVALLVTLLTFCSQTQSWFTDNFCVSNCRHLHPAGKENPPVHTGTGCFKLVFLPNSICCHSWPHLKWVEINLSSSLFAPPFHF